MGDAIQIGLVSADAELLQRVSDVARAAGATLVIGNDEASTRQVLLSRGFGARILDYRSRLVHASDGCRFLLTPSSLRSKCSDFDRAPDCFVENLPKRQLLLVTGEPFAKQPSQKPVQIRVYAPDQIAALVDDLSLLLPPVYTGDPASRILGNDPAVQRIREQVRTVSSFPDIPVLLLGETGTGKELVARAIHELSSGPTKPFVAINCAAIPDALFESELFGHEAGSYTGAHRSRVGLLEAAADGTIFLDEIGEMPGSLQPKLLRALESYEFRRVGANRSLPFQARVISATNQLLSGHRDAPLRSDLYYRLAGFTIYLPPLRERLGDIGLLTAAFLANFVARYRAGPRTFSEAALELLRSAEWPGNIRQLRTVVVRCAVLAKGPLVTADEVRACLDHDRPAPAAPKDSTPAAPADQGLRDVERDLVLKAFAAAGGNLSRAARALQIPRTTLRAKLRRFGVR